MESALGLLGVTKFHRLNFPDNALDSVPLLEVVQALENLCAGWTPPSIVMTHHPGDLNVDHQIANRAVHTLFRPQPGQMLKPRIILSFEVLSSTGWFGASGSVFVPNFFQDVSETLHRKLEALEAYATEMRPWPHARSLKAVEHLARFRGALVGLDAAEAFVIERMIQAT